MLAQGARIFYVSPRAQESGVGTLGRPFPNLEQAISKTALLRKRGFTGQITVLLRGGDYFLPNGLTIGNKVCSHAGATVFEAYKQEKPVLRGGVKLTGWRQQGDSYITHVPGDFEMNELFVDGVRYSRPRLPDTGYYHVEDALASPDRSLKGDTGMKTSPGQFNPGWANLGGVEVLLFHNWEISRLRIAAVDPANNQVSFRGSTQSADWGLVHKGGRFLIENVKEALSKPGQFYFDAASRDLSMIPLDGKDPAKSLCVAPTAETVLRVAGEPGGEDDQLANLRIVGLIVADSAWNMPDTGRTFPQAEADMSGAVVVNDARNVSFERCRISQTGGYGLQIAENAQNISFEDGEISDLGAGGVKIGLPTLTKDRKTLTRRNFIRRNVIAGGGRVHPAGVGVWIGQSPENLVEDNEIADFNYTGISIGWSWGYAATNTHDNRILGNHIHDIGRGVLSDMGGIYHLGIDPGAMISGNRIHDVKSFDYGGWGLYLDEGSTGVTMQDNVVYNCSRESFHQHYGKENMIRRNILAFGAEAQLARTRAEHHLSFTLENNIVIWKGTPLLWGNWSGQVASDGNLFWRTDGKPVTFNDLSISQWRALGRDVHSLFADPSFIAPEEGDFRLRPDSPALSLGFKAMDPRAAPWPSKWHLLPPAFPSGD